MPLVACGQTYSYVCDERTCLASFEGPGEQDLSDARGPTVEVVTIDDGPCVSRRERCGRMYEGYGQDKAEKWRSCCSRG